MATIAPEAETMERDDQQSIAIAVKHNPSLVIVDQAKRKELFEHIQSMIEAFKPDTSTKKGRADIKSLAFKITRTKTAIDGAGKEMTKEAREKIEAINAERKLTCARLAKVAEEVRKPLTDWESAEEQRIEACKAAIEEFRNAAIVTISDTVETVRDRGTQIWGKEIDPEQFQEFTDEATVAKGQAVSSLKAALDTLKEEQAQKAELERLRTEAAERERADAEKLAAKQQEQREAEAARVAEQEREAAAKAEQERIALAEKEATERAAREAEERHQRELAEERRKAEEAIANERAELDRIAAEKDAAEKAEREAKAQADKLSADKEHRAKVQAEACAAFVEQGLPVDLAAKVVDAIIAGTIPRVEIRF